MVGSMVIMGRSDDNIVYDMLQNKFNNIDISEHIYNFYLIAKYFNNGSLNNYNTYLFIDKFINNESYVDFILSKINFKNMLNIYFLEKLFINKEVMFKILNKMPSIIKYLKYNYRNDKDIITSVCIKDIHLFKYASHDIKNNDDFILHMIDININTFLYLDEEKKGKYEIALRAIKKNPNIILFLPDNMRNNSDINNYIKK